MASCKYDKNLLSLDQRPISELVWYLISCDHETYFVAHLMM